MHYTFHGLLAKLNSVIILVIMNNAFKHRTVGVQTMLSGISEKVLITNFSVLFL
jgi:hypothetical protein